MVLDEEETGDCPDLGFPKKEENRFQQYCNTYVTIYPPGSSRVFLGKMINLRDNVATLNPFCAVVYDGNGNGSKVLIEKNFTIGLTFDTGVEPATRESLEGYCVFCNKDK